MYIEKITENKIRITLNVEDLKEKNIDFHSFMANSLETQDLFLDMLAQAEKEVGFLTDNYKLMIEALAISDGNFILTVTRLPETTDKSKSKKLLIKRKSISPTNNLSIYCFNSFDDFCEFCINLNKGTYKGIIKKIKISKLYKYNSKYYLVLNNIKAELNIIKAFCFSIIEFSTYVNNSPDLFERKLIEYGELIIKSNAINTCLKHFA